MNRRLEARLSKVESTTPVKPTAILWAVNDQDEVDRLEAEFPDALIIHWQIVRPSNEEAKE